MNYISREQYLEMNEKQREEFLKKLTPSGWRAFAGKVMGLITKDEYFALEADEQLAYFNNLTKAERQVFDASIEFEATPKRPVLALADQHALAAQFLKQFPQFKQIPENVVALDSTISAKFTEFTPSLADVVETFSQLARAGRLVLDGTKVGLDSDYITGFELAHHPELWRLLSPVTQAPAERAERKRIQELSADQFREETPELQEYQIPWLVKKDAERAYKSFAASSPTYIDNPSNMSAIGNFIDKNGMVVSLQNIEIAFRTLAAQGDLELRPDARVNAGQTTMLDFGAPPSGIDYGNKYSFQKLLREMSPEELLERCQNDKKFEQAVNSLG